jgi:hypothetical protein
MRLKARLGIVLMVSLAGILVVGSNIRHAMSHQTLATGWTQTYGGTSDDMAYSVIETGDGGYALAGNTRIYGDDDFCLVKTDYEGKTLWNKTYTKNSKDGVFSFIQTADGGYALAGYTDGQIGSRPRFYLVRADADGNRLWNNTFGTGNGHYVAYSVVQTSDGGYALAGQTRSLGAGNWDFLLVRTDGGGAVPEFPSAILLALFMVAATLAAASLNKGSNSTSAHVNIKNTLVYTHLAEEIFKGRDEYVSKVARTEHDACTLIDSEFEFVCDFSGDKLFRKRKC